LWIEKAHQRFTERFGTRADHPSRYSAHCDHQAEKRASWLKAHGCSQVGL
jgi:hypothetical protein